MGPSFSALKFSIAEASAIAAKPFSIPCVVCNFDSVVVFVSAVLYEVFAVCVEESTCLLV